MTDDGEPTPGKEKQLAVLKEIWKHASKPQPTLMESLGDRYQEIVDDTEKKYLKKVSKYPGDPIPQEVWLDNGGRPLRIVQRDTFGRETMVETSVYDDGGYETERWRSQNNGYGTRRDYEYRQNTDGSKSLSKFTVTRFEGIGSDEKGMMQGG